MMTVNYSYYFSLCLFPLTHRNHTHTHTELFTCGEKLDPHSSYQLAFPSLGFRTGFLRLQSPHCLSPNLKLLLALCPLGARGQESSCCLEHNSAVKGREPDGENGRKVQQRETNAKKLKERTHGDCSLCDQALCWAPSCSIYSS